MIIPGLINAHLHSWQTGLRAVGADWTLLQYLTHIHVGVAQHYTDVHISNLAGAPNQINCGTNTLGDWWRCGPTPERTDAASWGWPATHSRTQSVVGRPPQLSRAPL